MTQRISSAFRVEAEAKADAPSPKPCTVSLPPFLLLLFVSLHFLYILSRFSISAYSFSLSDFPFLLLLLHTFPLSLHMPCNTSKLFRRVICENELWEGSWHRCIQGLVCSFLSPRLPFILPTLLPYCFSALFLLRFVLSFSIVLYSPSPLSSLFSSFILGCIVLTMNFFHENVWLRDEFQRKSGPTQRFSFCAEGLGCGIED